MKSNSQLIKKFKAKDFQPDGDSMSLSWLLKTLKSELIRYGADRAINYYMRVIHNEVLFRFTWDNEEIYFSTDLIKETVRPRSWGSQNNNQRNQEILENYKDDDHVITNIKIITNFTTNKKESIVISKDGLRFYLDGLFALHNFNKVKRAKKEKIKKIKGIGLGASLKDLAAEVNPDIVLRNINAETYGYLDIACGKTLIEIKKKRIKNREYINSKEDMKQLFEFVSNVEALRKVTKFPIEYTFQ